MVFFIAADGGRVEEATHGVRHATAAGHGRGNRGGRHDGRIVVDRGRVADRVQAHMVVVARRGAEQFSAAAARAVVLTCVPTLDVVVKGGPLWKTGAALSALERPFPSVQPCVVLQAQLTLKRLAAQSTQQWPPSWVVVHMVRQRWPVWEPQATHLRKKQNYLLIFRH